MNPCSSASGVFSQKHEDSSQAGPNSVLVKAETSDEGHTQQQLFIREDGE